MNNQIEYFKKYFQKYGFKNLYGKRTDFFDKEATIDEFLKLYPEMRGTFNKDITYDKLYEIAYEHVGHISFEEKTKDIEDYFYLLTPQDKVVAVAIGCMAYLVAKETDINGKSFEKAIDDIVTKVTGNKSYDINNPFDTKSGFGHRMFGHDQAAFGFKNIPRNYLIYVKNEAAPSTRKIIRVGEFLNLDESIEKVSMGDIIWKFYGNDSDTFKGIWNCACHILVHFAKDLFTPDGLPLPFTSMLEEFQQRETLNSYASILSYKDSFYKKSKNAHLKGSDFTSLITIEFIVKMYCEFSKIDGTKVNGYKDDMKMIAMSTCIILQISALTISDELKSNSNKIIDGAKINIPMLTIYMNILRREVVSIFQASHELKTMYKGMNYNE